MGVTRHSTTHIFDKCEHCEYRNHNECTYIRLHSNKNAVDNRPVWRRKNKKLNCPKQESGVNA